MSKKDEKRKEIAKSCCKLFIKDGFNKISVSEIAKRANIGKGTVYEYFETKTDIILELMKCLEDEYEQIVLKDIDQIDDNKKFIEKVFEVFLDDSEHNIVFREIFKEFIISLLNSQNKRLKEYYAKFRKKYIDFIEENTNIKFDTIFDDIIAVFLTSLVVETNLKEKVKNIINEV